MRILFSRHKREIEIEIYFSVYGIVLFSVIVAYNGYSFVNASLNSLEFREMEDFKKETAEPRDELHKERIVGIIDNAV